MPSATLGQRLGAEALGTGFLLATVVGSGIMAERLADGNVALALLCNTLPTGAILVVLITALGPISGAHINPAVTAVFFLRGEMRASEATAYVGIQIVSGIIGVLIAHLMFDETVIQLSAKLRDGPSQWFSEAVATFGLVATILLTLRARAAAVPMAVGLYITAAYWFTASTSFANPAVTIGRAFSDTFAGIAPANVPAFVAAQFLGAAAALAACCLLLGEKMLSARTPIVAKDDSV